MSPHYEDAGDHPLAHTFAMVATVLFCLVAGFSNGNTLTARCWGPAGAETITVPLAEVVAPASLAIGDRGWQNPNMLCLKRQALAKPKTAFRGGQVVTRVECDGFGASAEGFLAV